VGGHLPGRRSEAGARALRPSTPRTRPNPNSRAGRTSRAESSSRAGRTTGTREGRPGEPNRPGGSRRAGHPPAVRLFGAGRVGGNGPGGKPGPCRTARTTGGRVGGRGGRPAHAGRHHQTPGLLERGRAAPGVVSLAEWAAWRWAGPCRPSSDGVAGPYGQKGPGGWWAGWRWAPRLSRWGSVALVDEAIGAPGPLRWCGSPQRSTPVSWCSRPSIASGGPVCSSWLLARAGQPDRRPAEGGGCPGGVDAGRVG